MTCQVTGCALLMEHRHEGTELVEHDPRVLHVPEVARLRAALAGLVEAAKDLERNGIMAVHSGGDSAMVFDEFDAAAERERKGWYSVNKAQVDALRVALRIAEEALKP